MAINDLPLFSVLKSKMKWHEARQRLLAENVANADTPGYRPRDLKNFDIKAAASTRSLSTEKTHPHHIPVGGISGSDKLKAGQGELFETRPSGNAVTLEDEMLKVSMNQLDHQAASAVYQRSMALMKLALGKRA